MRHVVFSKLEKRKDVQLELLLNTGEAVLEVASVSMSTGLPIDGPARGANGAPQCGPGPGVLLACRIGCGRPFPGLDV
jgi:hypothetical protein